MNSQEFLCTKNQASGPTFFLKTKVLPCLSVTINNGSEHSFLLFLDSEISPCVLYEAHTCKILNWRGRHLTQESGLLTSLINNQQVPSHIESGCYVLPAHFLCTSCVLSACFLRASCVLPACFLRASCSVFCPFGLVDHHLSESFL